MTLPVKHTYAPMEARLVPEIPGGGGWQYEPKWDGFRCLAFREGDAIDLRSKAGKPLTRYFPDLIEGLEQLEADTFVLDGEIVVPMDGMLSFDELLLRIHPARSRVQKLASEHPVLFIVFDLLVDERGRSLVDTVLEDRRARLETFAKRYFPADGMMRLSPATRRLTTVRKWFKTVGTGLDGVVAKCLELPYRTGERTGMQKVKNMRTAECVVGGFRYASKGEQVGSLLLGLYDDGGLLHHVGFTSSFRAAERVALMEKVARVMGGQGFTGQTPGGPSRWSTERSSEWEPLAPTLVVEVQYDHFAGGRFRHGTKFLRWRPDKAPRQCTMAQVAGESRSPLRLLA